MAKALTTTRASVTCYNLVDDDTQGGASSTKKCSDIVSDGTAQVTNIDENRQGVLKNKIDFTNVVGTGRPSIDANAGASSVGVANIFRVLKVPEKTMIERIVLTATGSTAPTHSHTGDSGASTVLNFQAAAFTNASKNAFKYDTDGFGTLAVTNSGGAIAGMPTISASTPETRSKVVTTSSAGTPLYFPFGGYVEMQMSGGASTNSVTADGAFAGELTISAIGHRLP